MRCPDCNKFVSYDTEAEPEETSEPSLSGTTLTAEYRRVLNCGECGQELKDAELSIEVKVEFRAKDEDEQDCSHEDADLSDLSAEPTDRAQTHDRHGKPITNFRYARHYYGVQLSGTITCNTCGATAEVDATAEEQASGFNELV